MTKNEVLDIIRKTNSHLARDMKKPNFLGWLVLSAYIQEKGNMRDLEVVISEFSSECYPLMEETKEEIAPRLEKAKQEVSNSKTPTTFCKIALKQISIYQKYYNMAIKFLDVFGDNIGYDGGNY